MTDPSDTDPVPESTPEAWRPSPELRTRLAHGALAALVAGALSAAGGALDLSRPNEEGYTLAMALLHAAILPEVWVLLAFLGLARETGSDGLNRSSVGVIVSAWLLFLLVLGDEELLPDPWWKVALGGVAVGMAALMGYVLYPLLKGAGCMVVFGFFLIVRLVARLLRRQGALQQLGGPAILFLGLAAVVAVFLVGVSVWFAVSLIRLRQKLGGAATANGVAVLVGLVVLVGFVGWLIAGFVAVLDQPAADEKAIEAALAPRLHALNATALLANVAGTLLLVWLFLSARARGAYDTPVYDKL